jgi:pyruvate-formate lyase-activating enzyme
MPAAWIPLARSCNNACRFCAVQRRLDGRRLDWEEVAAMIEQARKEGATEVVFTGGEPTLSAHFVRALATARGLGLRTAASTNGRLLSAMDKVGRLEATGIDALHIALHAVDPALHNELVGGDPIAHEQTSRALHLCAPRFDTTLRTVLTRTNAAEIPGLVRLAAELGTRFDLRNLLPAGAARAAWEDLYLPDDAALDLLLATRTLARSLGVRFTAWGFPAWSRLDRESPAAGVPLDEDVRWLLRQGLATRSMLGGLKAPSPADWQHLAQKAEVPAEDLPLELAARHLPVLDLPVEVGGVSPTPVDLSPDWRALLDPARLLPIASRPAGGPIHVVDASLTEPWLGLHTLPGLVHHLRELGAEVVHHRLWSGAFDPARFDPPEVRGVFGRVSTGLRKALQRQEPARLPHPERPGPEAEAILERFFAEVDLAGAAVIVVSSHAEAARIRRHPTVPATARLEILEQGLLDGYHGDLGPRDVVRMPWPNSRKVYAAAGIASAHLLLRPHPLFLPHFTALTPAARSQEVLLVGGPGLDTALAQKVVAQLGLKPLAIDAPGLGEPVGPSWQARLAALGRARLVWWPQRLRRALPADVRWLSLALVAGRPVLAAELPSVTHHVWQGHDGLLFSPGDLRGARESMERLIGDEDLLTMLTAGSHARREAVSTRRWAEELLHGAPPARAVPRRPGFGPWTAW